VLERGTEVTDHAELGEDVPPCLPKPGPVRST